MKHVHYLNAVTPPKSLTPRQAEFCLQYVLTNNKAKASRLSGYARHNSSSIGCRLLKRTDVIGYVEELRAEAQRRTNVPTVDNLAEDRREAKLFARECMTHGNTSQAARTVGYPEEKAQRAIARFLRRDDVREALINHAAHQAFLSMLDFMEFDENMAFRWKLAEDLTKDQVARTAWLKLDEIGRITQIRLKDSHQELCAVGLGACLPGYD